jgi:hypothetical protein
MITLVERLGDAVMPSRLTRGWGDDGHVSEIDCGRTHGKVCIEFNTFLCHVVGGLSRRLLLL